MTRAPSPDISVLLPVHDGMPYLPRAIESVLAQTHHRFELLVIDDGSIDGTGAYLAQIDDPRVRIVRRERSGLGESLNAGLALARAPFVARHDADDWSAPDRFARQLAWLESHSDVGVLATAVDFADEQGSPVDSAWTRSVHRQWDAALSPDAIAELMPLTCCIFHATVVARTEVLRSAGGYDPAMVPAEDYDLWLRLLPHHRFARLPDRLYTVRIHAASSSTVRRGDQLARVIAAKLRFVRREVPHLRVPATLALPFDDRGAAAFRAAASAEGYAIVDDGDDRSMRAADVIAVTNFSQLDRFAASLDASRYRRFGNLFVRSKRQETTSTFQNVRRAGPSAFA
jgi:glycosyltransferase involved in cell wall biosynthesis